MWLHNWAERWGCVFVTLYSISTVSVIYFDTYLWGVIYDSADIAEVFDKKTAVMLEILCMNAFSLTKFVIDLFYAILFYRFMQLIKQSNGMLDKLQCPVIFFFSSCLTILLTRDVIAYFEWLIFSRKMFMSEVRLSVSDKEFLVASEMFIIASEFLFNILMLYYTISHKVHER